jgi:hypothetical protein
MRYLVGVDPMHPRYRRDRDSRGERLLDDAPLLLARSILPFARTGCNCGGVVVAIISFRGHDLFVAHKRRMPIRKGSV